MIKTDRVTSVMTKATINPLDLTDRHILVTGATGGIGRSVAILLSQLGARLLVTARDIGKLNRTYDLLYGDGHHAAVFDMSDVDDLPGWIKAQAEECGLFHGAVHCAGIQHTKPVRNTDLAFFDETMHVNLASAFALARGIRRRGNREPNTSIVLISSIAGMIGQPGNAVYAASKGGLSSATKAFAMEFLKENIRVNAIAPALVETDMADKNRTSMTADQFQQMVDRHPLGLGQPEDVAYATAFLLSPAARWITGTTLLLDGGYLCK